MRYLEFEKPIGELERKIEDLRQYAKREDLDLASEIEPLERRLREAGEQRWKAIIRELDRDLLGPAAADP